MNPSKAPADIRSVDGWSLRRFNKEAFATFYRYTRPDIDDVAIICIPRGKQPDKAMISDGLNKLMERGPPPAHA